MTIFNFNSVNFQAMKLIISFLFFAITLKSIQAGGGGSCTSTFKLVDPNTGAYLKTLCFVSARLIHQQAVQYCFDNGMEIYTVDSAAEIEPMANYIMIYHPPGWKFYLNSVRDSETMVWNPLLNDAVMPIFDDGQNCILIRGDGAFETDTCELEYTFLCQFL